ncbi:Putative metallocarboxypeptidase ECM14 [Psilocybe cubensis]|uniref:Inactive metallocarboxypeptidase ECM14 n=2 Tax=Psilocybe cubensis TaxID=181762 RepID=A0A8H7XKM8_PSICU|nr:Putative metallocarboxypeptidase ECM14 [Psilocybe cubensis]KAH9476328.1 Putative metallocarboxypeptidase ECM14 [Psilocybe cubensis]
MIFRILCLFTLLQLALCEQQVLTEQSNFGLLRRFSSVQEALDVAQARNLDVWHQTKTFVDIYFPPDELHLPDELKVLPHNDTLISAIPPRRMGLGGFAPFANSSFHDVYHPLDELTSFIHELANTHPNITRITNLGTSAEGRDVLALTISTGPYSKKMELKKGGKKKRPSGPAGDKLGFVIVGAQHAREWIATATSVYLAHALVADASEPHSLSPLLTHFDFHIVPVPNPDGYEFTWSTDRFWYKNRQILGPHEKCIGLDMNRNWGYKWKREALDRGLQETKPRVPTNPCSHWYPGTRAFEAPEVNNLANWVATLPNVVAFIDLRSYGQMLSSPYSYTCKKQPKDAEDQVEAALGASQALKSVHGTHFQTGKLCSMLYAAPGNILDWMYARVGIKYSYVAHLRDTGTYGFALPEKWIRPTGEETASLVDYLSRFIAKQAKSS